MKSLEGLEKIRRVMDYLITKAEINSLAPVITLEENKSIDGVEKQDFEDIIYRLIKEKILKDKETIWYEQYGPENDFIKETDGESYNITVNYEEFNKFSKELDIRIGEVKWTPPEIYQIKEKAMNGVDFNEENATLTIGTYSIQIDQKNKKTLAHNILSLFKNDFQKEIDYPDIFEDVEGMNMSIKKHKDRYYEKHYYLKIYLACKDIQEKIQKKTEFKIKDFLIFNSSQTGRVKINKKYL
jgi:hypothetical protein